MRNKRQRTLVSPSILNRPHRVKVSLSDVIITGKGLRVFECLFGAKVARAKDFLDLSGDLETQGVSGVATGGAKEHLRRVLTSNFLNFSGSS